MILYGIPNCNTVKKAKDWLLEHNLEYEFYDFKKKSITAEKLAAWCSALGWEKVLNKKGTTWKKQSLEEQSKVIDEPSAIVFLVKHTSAIKRPVLEVSSLKTLIGFDEVYTDPFNDKYGTLMTTLCIEKLLNTWLAT